MGKSEVSLYGIASSLFGGSCDGALGLPTAGECVLTVCLHVRCLWIHRTENVYDRRAMTECDLRLERLCVYCTHKLNDILISLFTV